MRLKFFSFVLAVIAIVAISSFSTPRKSAAQQVWLRYTAGYDDFASHAHLFSRSVGLWQQGSLPLDSLRTLFAELRLRWKNVEFLAEHTDKHTVRDFINGAPLPKLERNAPVLSTVSPKGLQVIEELVYSDSPADSASVLGKLSSELASVASIGAGFAKAYHPTDRVVMESLRFGVVRVVSLGITGFDTPASDNAIAESARAMTSMAATFSLWCDAFGQPVPHRSAADSLFRGAVAALNANADFDTFDRLSFVRTWADPLYGALLDIHMSLYIETYDDVAPFAVKNAVNYRARSIYGADFLNPLYSLRLSPAEMSAEMVELGKMLFYDPVLSANARRACASCHAPEQGFADGKPKSIATDFQGTVARNAPTLLNAVYAERYFYDLRAHSLDAQMEHVVASHQEFATSFEDISHRLAQSSEYRLLFEKAFPKRRGAIDKYAVTGALSAYVASLRSWNSPVDRFVRGETASLPEPVRRGYNLFHGKAACATCHFAPSYAGLVPPYYDENESEVLGVPASADTAGAAVDPDLGRYSGYLKERVPFYAHSFKTTTVRNVALTAPYMHNGVYSTLEQVIDFYNRGGGAGIGIDLPFQTLPPDPLGLTKQEASDLAAFMQALTDTTGLASRPARLPAFPSAHQWNKRIIGGEY